jgi:hypothetical protein
MPFNAIRRWCFALNARIRYATLNARNITATTSYTNYVDIQTHLIKAGQPCTISHSIVSADDWRVLFDDAIPTDWSPTTPILLMEDDWAPGHPGSTSTPPTVTQQPGYPTLSDVTRLQNNQRSTPPARLQRNQAGPSQENVTNNQSGGPVRRGTRAAQGRSIFNP